MRRILRKIVAGEGDQLGDLSSVAEPSVVDESEFPPSRLWSILMCSQEGCCQCFQVSRGVEQEGRSENETRLIVLSTASLGTVCVYASSSEAQFRLSSEAAKVHEHCKKWCCTACPPSPTLDKTLRND